MSIAERELMHRSMLLLLSRLLFATFHGFANQSRQIGCGSTHFIIVVVGVKVGFFGQIFEPLFSFYHSSGSRSLLLLIIIIIWFVLSLLWLLLLSGLFDDLSVLNALFGFELLIVVVVVWSRMSACRDDRIAKFVSKIGASCMGGGFGQRW